ncbi:hypothetical protein [Janthinobacterium sp. SUN206]|uniref:hypothetical protein n=1 Tax=Janthinobacterium sp. SUN206 TaxID=3014787 RepID=UPI0027134AB9|nr:hypothetical protein [Janthinobacterium sp. SUN206]MDO8065565.1 hypothetical protein [Janthinobacterium sp. SUN206]
MSTGQSSDVSISDSQTNHEYELQLAAIKSHDRHMDHVYRLRWGGLALATFTVLLGAVMVFLGLQGSFGWAIEAPNSIGAKLTNASPGIVFATIGLILGFIVAVQRPLTYRTDARNGAQSLHPNSWRRS